MIARIVIALIPVTGAIILFASWVLQQTRLEHANSTLLRIFSAENTFQTYQSNNALFNAITRLCDNDNSLQEYVRTVQLYNYELGLRDLEALLPGSERAGIPDAVNAYGGEPTPEQKMSIVQERLEKIQAAIASEKKRIEEGKAYLNRLFFGLYALGSVMVLAGSVLNAIRNASHP